MNILQILVLAVVQGIAELLPVSSSAHVIVAEKLMGLDPTAPEMTLLLVMLHTGTMFAVIVYFWKSWRESYFSSVAQLKNNGARLLVATAATGVVGLLLMQLIKHVFAADASKFEIEQLFGNARLMAAALASAGILIILSARMSAAGRNEVTLRSALYIGAVQVFVLAVSWLFPFRRDHLDRSCHGCGAPPCRAIQLRARRHFDACRDCQGSLPPLQRRACGGRNGAAAFGRPRN